MKSLGVVWGGGWGGGVQQLYVWNLDTRQLTAIIQHEAGLFLIRTHTATYYNAVQHKATSSLFCMQLVCLSLLPHCNVLQHIATPYNTVIIQYENGWSISLSCTRSFDIVFYLQFPPYLSLFFWFSGTKTPKPCGINGFIRLF